MALRFNLLNRPSFKIAFIDVEASADGKKLLDFGALHESGLEFHSSSKQDFVSFVRDAEYLCGHNIVHHDLKIVDDSILSRRKKIDTLFLSPLLFPERPYHKLLKDDKLQSDELNNPLNDCKKARDLFYDEINAFNALPQELKQIYCNLLSPFEEFRDFFKFVGASQERIDVTAHIASFFDGRICSNADIGRFVRKHPVELAYALALVNTNDHKSITPPWLLHNYAAVEHIIRQLCGRPCHSIGCQHCNSLLDIHRGLESVFGYTEFRSFEGEPMQERAVQAAMDGESLLTVFPTGGGKSLTFQLPAIMFGRAVHGLTVVISPLQSLMKDQVDNLETRNITEAVTINGLMDPISRKNAFERAADGTATMLYISPEMLRSKTIEKILLSRNVIRFVIDEAHCFSSWGQDFRVDYLYIGDFIRQLQEKKRLQDPIPVSCFTATAKQKVISDIRDYFKRKLGINLALFSSPAARHNLKYAVIHAETEEEKYSYMRNLLAGNDKPTIVYVSRTRKAAELSQKLTKDGYPALPFHGKMDANVKVENQNAFMNNDVRVMVATSAFGMGVDKKDVGMVIHYDISDSLENYVQEAGRAGRDPEMEAECFVLYSDHDLDKHFILLNQTKLSIGEIQQVWTAVKTLTKQCKTVQCSALEIARQAGWNEGVADIEARVRTAISALEQAGYVKRGNNVPHVFASGIAVKNMDEARRRLEQSPLFDETSRDDAVRIIKSLISSRQIAKATTDDNDTAESRVDYLADMLGMSKAAVIGTVNLMRQDGILSDSQDMTARLQASDTERKLLAQFERFALLERFLITNAGKTGKEEATTYKKLNELAMEQNLRSTVKDMRTVLNFLALKSYVQKQEHARTGSLKLSFNMDVDSLLRAQEKRIELCRFIIRDIFSLKQQQHTEPAVCFSTVDLLNKFSSSNIELISSRDKIQINDVEEALLFLSKTGILKLEGGFLVVYNAMQIQRVSDMKYRYKIEDYRMLDEFYKQKIRQIHIVGEYANLMVKDYNAALKYVQDYFLMDSKKFIDIYFKGERASEIEKNITPEKYRRLFGQLSDTQRRIITDKASKYMVVAAGPGSGKTRVLVHKLASLLLMEDVKHEQLLMLTFSRAAATEFKERLVDLIGNAAFFVEIKTFHSFCFDLLGENGSIEDSQDVVERARLMVERNDAEPGMINRAVLVIDEAQDMDAKEYALVRALMHCNESMRVIAVGDDDQNIYGFRGSDAKYMRMMIEQENAVKYEMTENYRSAVNIVDFAESFVKRLSNRMKTNECTAVKEVTGLVDVTEHSSGNILLPLSRHVQSTYRGERACVLTATNEEAAQVAAMLKKNGLRARLIQSTEGFSFCNLMEVRYFTKKIDENTTATVVSDEVWEYAKHKTLEKYANSPFSDYLKVFFNIFEKTNKTKYRSDLDEFLKESKLEDFCRDESKTILVSTIHKSKGREFDTVYMLLKNAKADTDEQVRNLYVGITRAKKSLYIHCDNGIFEALKSDRVSYRYDTAAYPAPEEVVLQLSMRDVYLDFFKNKKNIILRLSGNVPLSYSQGLFTDAAGYCVSCLSKSRREDIMRWREKGYEVASAKIFAIVAWKGNGDSEECAVVLPEMVLKKSRQ